MYARSRALAHFTAPLFLDSDCEINLALARNPAPARYRPRLSRTLQWYYRRYPPRYNYGLTSRNSLKRYSYRSDAAARPTPPCREGQHRWRTDIASCINYCCRHGIHRDDVNWSCNGRRGRSYLRFHSRQTLFVPRFFVLAVLNVAPLVRLQNKVGIDLSLTSFQRRGIKTSERYFCSFILNSYMSSLDKKKRSLFYYQYRLSIMRAGSARRQWYFLEIPEGLYSPHMARLTVYRVRLPMQTTRSRVRICNEQYFLSRKQNRRGVLPSRTDRVEPKWYVDGTI